MLAALLIPLFAQAQLPQLPAPTKVLATVDGRPIKVEDVAPYLWDARGYELTQDLIHYELARAEAERTKISVSDEELAKTVAEQLAQIKQSLPPDADLDQAMRERGLPKSRLALLIKTDLLLSKIALANFKPENYVKVSTILVAPKADSTTALGEAIKLSEAAYGRLKKGEDWKKVLQSTTDDPNMLKANGFLGWRALENFPASAQAELKALAPNGVTKPVQTKFGIQIFRLESNGKTAKPEELDDLRRQYSVTGRATLLQRLKAQAKIEQTP
jgi:parvulin-like peptidyl-prolyl isomerase